MTTKTTKKNTKGAYFHLGSSLSFLSALRLLCSSLWFLWSQVVMRSYLFFIVCCLLAAVAPLAPIRSDVTNEQAAFPGWPAQLEGRNLTQLPLSPREERFAADFPGRVARFTDGHREIIIRWRSEEHTSELQSLRHLVCRLLLEKKKKK